MIKKLLFSCFLIATFSFAFAQIESPQVPARMDFAGIKLHINEQARREIQADVDALTRSEKYFMIKLERVDLYFPIIERIFREENLPDDFKYLAIQESALIPDAVSTSNAVGYWQFKQASAEEVGMRVDKFVDERMNLNSATRGAAKYLKRNNFFFNNWLNALLSYNLGRGGAENVVNKKDYGAAKMDIDQKTHWYVKKFIAHKIAFEPYLGKSNAMGLRLLEFEEAGDKSLFEISKEFNVDPETLENYNKWLLKGKVPTDKTYVVLLPMSNTSPNLASNRKAQPQVEQVNSRLRTDAQEDSENKYPNVTYASGAEKSYKVKVNDLDAIIAQEGDTWSDLADRANTSPEKIWRYNDLDKNPSLVPGQFYYLKSKKNKAKVYFHTVKSGETLWELSQRYGIKLKALMTKNRMEKVVDLKTGRVLWLRNTRPASVPIEYRNVPVKIEEKKPEQPVKPVVVEEKMPEQSITAVVEEKPLITEVVIPIQEDRTEEMEIAVKEEEEKEALASKGSSELQGSPKNGEEAKPKQEIADPVVFDTTGVKFLSYPAAEVTIAKEEQKPVQKSHTVKAGETLYRISVNYGIALNDLRAWNGLLEGEAIKPGQVLLLEPVKVEAVKDTPGKPNSVVAKETYIEHEVKAGENMYKIARDYGVTIKELMEWNQKEEFNLSVGEKLKVKKPSNQ